MILNSLTALTAWTADPTYLHILYSSLVIIILIIIIRPSDSDSWPRWPYVLLRMFLSDLFRHLISEIAWLTVTKLCHMTNGHPGL